MHSYKRVLAGIGAAIVLSAAAYAADLTGTVTNKTTNKPASGDEVVLMSLAQGMDEVARTKTDAQGKFRFTLPDASTPHLIRVSHRNVNYHRPAPPGTTSVEIEVFESAEQVPGIRQTVDVMRVEADATTLRVIEMYELENQSSPPRTQMGPKNFEVALPDGAKLEQALAAGPGGMPVTSAPVPTGEKNHYSFIFPIRPGQTRFQVEYSLPYDGKKSLKANLLREVESFAVSVPKSMEFKAEGGSRIEPKGEEAGMKVYVAQNATPGQTLSFQISGTGSAPVDAQTEGGGQTAAPGESSGRPGGGLGAPANTPDPLYKYRWWIIGAVALLLVAGAGYSLRGGAPVTPVQMAASQISASNGILEVLKHEMFELESQRISGKVEKAEYEQTKAALDLLLRRALKQQVTK